MFLTRGREEGLSQWTGKSESLLYIQQYFLHKILWLTCSRKIQSKMTAYMWKILNTQYLKGVERVVFSRIVTDKIR